MPCGPAPSRRVLLAVVAALVAGLVVGTAGADRAAACSCAALDDMAAFELADVVFQGRLVEIVTPAGENWSSADPEAFVFAVDKVFKGEVAERQSVLTARSGASCGLEIGVGGPYLLFGREGDQLIGVRDGLTSNLCSGTRRISDTAAVPATFGAGVAPLPGDSGVDLPADDGPPVGWIALAAAAAMVTLGTVVVIRRR